MKQIKTIVKRRDYPKEFDNAVNEAISSGWTLVSRYIDGGVGEAGNMAFYPVFVAELEREANELGK